MDGNDNKTDTTEVTACAIEHLQVSQSHPERDVVILDTETGKIGMFGYFCAKERWHFMFVPPEFRDEVPLEAVRRHLMEKHQAVLRTIPGDRISNRGVAVQQPDEIRPRPHLS